MINKEIRKALKRKWADARKPPTPMKITLKKNRHATVDPEHPKCPWCKNESTVFASGKNEFRCVRCKKVFDKFTSAGSCTVIDHVYPIIEGQKVRRCYCGKKTFTVTQPTITTNQSGEHTMKKNVSAKSSKKSATKSNDVRESRLSYRFVRLPKEALREGTVDACILDGMKKIKSGSLDEATAAALKAGMETGQEPSGQVRSHLRKLANLGLVSVEGSPERSAKKAKTTKTSKKKNGAKKIVLKAAK